MKMCVLADKKVETTGSDCRERSEMKAAMMDATKPRGSSFDGNRARSLSHEYRKQKDRSHSDPSPCREDKRTNSDDESEAKCGSDTRDQAVDAALATKGLDTLATMASAASSMQQEENRSKERLEPHSNITKPQTKSPPTDVKKRTDEADNSNKAPTNQHPRSAIPPTDKITSSTSRNSPCSPPSDRYAPYLPQMHAPPPGYCPPHNPYYPYYGHGHFMPSPPRVHPPSPYLGHYYPPHAHAARAHHQVHSHYKHPYMHGHHEKVPAAVAMPHKDELKVDEGPSESKKARRPSQEGLPLKKRKFEDAGVDLHEEVQNPKSSQVKAGCLMKEDAGNQNEARLSDVCGEEKAEVTEREGHKTQGSLESLEHPKKIPRKSSEVVTPSPRSLDSRSAHSSSGSVPEEVVKADTGEEKGNDVEKTTYTSQGLQSPSPPAVHPSFSRSHYRSEYPSKSHHPHEPHYPSPLRAAQSLKHRERSLVSPPHHYPYASHHGPHMYRYPNYYPSQYPHEHAPYWHRHPYPYPPPQHRPPHVGDAGPKPTYKPVEIVTSAKADGQEVKALKPPDRVESSSGKAVDACISKDPSASTGFSRNPESTMVGEQNGRRCVHVHGPMLIHFMGKRGAPETLSDATALPSFYKLVNFPEFLPQKNNHFDCTTLSDDEAKQKANPTTKNCVMCGTCCFFVSGNASRDKCEQAAVVSSPYIIPRQNKGLCTACDVKVWLVRDLDLTIKWCKGCKNFRSWSAFGEKTRATKCSKCRDRQREKYAAQKEALRRKRAGDKEKERGSDSEDSEETGRREGRASDDEIDAASGLCNMMKGYV